VATQEELLASVLDDASCVKEKWENQNRWAITPSLLMSCKGHWGWWDFQTFIVNLTFVIEVSH
jgi:hypothetical protein